MDSHRYLTPKQQSAISQRTSSAQLTSFYVVASCGLLPRTTRPGPRLRTAFWSVASPHPREVGVARALAVDAMFVRGGADQVQDSRRSSASSDSAARVRVAKREDSYGPKSGPNAGSRASSPGEQAAACDYIKTRELGSTPSLPKMVPHSPNG